MKNEKLIFAKTKLMKLTAIATLAVCALLASCGNKNSTTNLSRNSNMATTSNVIGQLTQNYDAQQNSANTTPAQDNSQNSEAAIAAAENLVSGQPPNKDGIDVDLTQLSSTMVYAEVFNMLISPESYVGKTVKMRGNFNYFQAIAPDGKMINRLFYACSIADATACCQQGLEFELAGNKKFPEEYPDPGSEITVVGTFEIYEDAEYGFTSMRIANAEYFCG